ncbi:MAG: UDP-2,3-diacylglucosamine diphosphatase [Hylemonella sp.]|nr:UDP-2,3-diacylglucosamine diphosphatase [Hylemonella sp.]MDP1936461.1 UDP-2,3-diacylglucosamine diphosphatase [Hylemonella sp.]
MDPTTPRIAELTAPAAWQVVDFISDLHLQASEPATVQAWAHYMAHTRADAVFILGDLFEVWVGDDGPASTDVESRFEAHCVHLLHTTAQRRAVFLMHGNRDFLLGDAFAQAAGLHLLADPTVLTFGAQRWLLSHGDALCLDDTDYLQFRAQVRSPEWQQAFLAKPLSERRAIARGLRTESEARKRSGAVYADVDATAAAGWLHAAQARELIHGHTHKPADHAFGDGLRRRVLSDWDAAATPPRAEVLRLQLDAGAVQVQRLPTQQAV